MKPVTGLHFLDDGALFVLVGLLPGNCLVLRRIEFFADGRNRRNALRLQGILELAHNHPQTVEPVSVDAFRSVVQGAAQIVEDGKQLAQQLLVGILRAVGELLTGASLVILEVSGEPLVAGEVRLNLVARRLQLGVDAGYYLTRPLLRIDG